tara:strand:+ start:870 stop:1079 length:210 start_codon:yes stop_codon:yes gene_type:complete
LCRKRARKRERKPNATPFFITKLRKPREEEEEEEEETTTTSDDDFHDDDFVEQSRPIFTAIFGEEKEGS